jgi:HPt (histidine-containing phosphotransfer) domain-containing protein
MQRAQHPILSEALDRLWVEFLPEMEGRVATLAAASAALAGDKLSLTERGRANDAAHKLAGVLGTFGLTRGTILAREAEILYSGSPETDPEAAERLRQIAEQLKALIASRKESPSLKQVH